MSASGHATAGGRDGFRRRAVAALADAGLQRALRNVPRGFIAKRRAALAALPEYPELRAAAAAMRRHVLDNLDLYLARFIDAAENAGAEIHVAADAEEARRLVTGILRAAGARRVVKGKSMISEEIALNDALAGAGLEVVESDLGEYVIQLRGEQPSHIVAPAIHLSRRQIEADFRRHHTDLPADRVFADNAALVAEARRELRRVFCRADAGITGANLLIAETGSCVLVTNEGNGDLTATLPPLHIVVTSIEKIVPTLEDADLVLRLLARSATGQTLTTYTSFFTGPRRAGDADGPRRMHIVLLDNRRSEVLAGPFADILRCIRCGACLNHCPVFGAVGGHAYLPAGMPPGVYPGPMGEVLQPALHGVRRAADLADACTLCGRCAEVCPVEIPLPALIRRWRAEAMRAGAAPRTRRLL
ncbi:MAG TPA: lactate utilization protein, partial [Thermopetrobacter sp.]|nr:lactate utilization protein [Thermopetrobacter sp.]